MIADTTKAPETMIIIVDRRVTTNDSKAGVTTTDYFITRRHRKIITFHSGNLTILIMLSVCFERKERMMYIQVCVCCMKNNQSVGIAFTESRGTIQIKMISERVI